MINLDLSKALHPWFLGPAASVRLALFFEICVLLAEPDWVQHTISHAQLKCYMGITVALILAFIIGNGFLFWVMMLRMESERFCTGGLSSSGEVCEIPVELERQPTEAPVAREFQAGRQSVPQTNSSLGMLKVLLKRAALGRFEVAGHDGTVSRDLFKKSTMTNGKPGSQRSVRRNGRNLGVHCLS